MLRYQDGFDHLDNNRETICYKSVDGNSGAWANTNTIDILTPGVYNYGSALKVYFNNWQKNFDNQATWILGLHIKRNTEDLQDGWTVLFMDSSNVQCGLKYESQYFTFYRGDAAQLLGTSSNSFDLTTDWFWLDLKVVINNTTGSVLLKINGATEIDLSNQDTQETANAYAYAIALLSPNVCYTYYDNLYIADGQAGEITDILGECRIYTQKGNADGTVNQFTPSAGDNHENIDEEIHDSDTTYNSSDTIGYQDLYNIEDFSASGIIRGVQITNAIRKDDVGDRKIKNLIRLGSTIYKGDEQTILTSYRYYTKLYELNPDDAGNFEDADIDAAQIGIEMTS